MKNDENVDGISKNLVNLIDLMSLLMRYSCFVLVKDDFVVLLHAVLM